MAQELPKSTEMLIIEGDCCVSIDVECAATGHGHLDQEPCRIAMVDNDGKTIFDMITKVPNMADPLIEFTGLSRQQIDDGVELQTALDELHKMLMKFQSEYKFGVTIVGQAVSNDIMWTKLEKGKHYNRMFDLAPMFKARYFYSLRQCVWALLQKDMRKNFHDPAEDARCSMQLYRKFAHDRFALHQAKKLLISLSAANAFPNFYVSTKYRRCSGMYNKHRCWCRQPVMSDVREVDEMIELMKGVQIVTTMQKDVSKENNNNHNGWIRHGVCRNWQKGGVCRFQKCKFLHVCNGCGAEHPQSECKLNIDRK